MKRGSAGRSRGKIRYAVVGLGHIAQVAVLPAFAHARRNSVLAALVSDDERKLRTLGRRYGVARLCGYDDVDELFASGEIDAVYVALPNSMHAEYTVRAARAGLHVLCEKPMAVTTRECEQMIQATERAGVKLMIAYRLHFERANLEATRIVRSRKLGEIRYFDSQFSMQVKRGNIRLDCELGGGPLYDIGIYCINAARAAFAAEPTHVWATATNSGDARFKEVPETVSAVLKFPGHRVATFTCSFGAADDRGRAQAAPEVCQARPVCAGAAVLLRLRAARSRGRTLWRGRARRRACHRSAARINGRRTFRGNTPGAARPAPNAGPGSSPAGRPQAENRERTGTPFLSGASRATCCRRSARRDVLLEDFRRFAVLPTTDAAVILAFREPAPGPGDAVDPFFDLVEK